MKGTLLIGRGVKRTWEAAVAFSSLAGAFEQ